MLELNDLGYKMTYLNSVTFNNFFLIFSVFMFFAFIKSLTRLVIFENICFPSLDSEMKAIKSVDSVLEVSPMTVEQFSLKLVALLAVELCIWSLTVDTFRQFLLLPGILGGYLGCSFWDKPKRRLLGSGVTAVVGL